MKLAILAKEGFNVDVLLNPKLTTVDFPSEQRYQQPIDYPFEAPEPERKSRKTQFKLSWELKCQNVMHAGILCYDHPCVLCNQKCACASMLYSTIGTEDRRILNQKKPQAVIIELTTIDLWTIMEAAFVRPLKLTFNWNLLFSRKQKR